MIHFLAFIFFFLEISKCFERTLKENDNLDIRFLDSLKDLQIKPKHILFARSSAFREFLSLQPEKKPIIHEIYKYIKYKKVKRTIKREEFNNIQKLLLQSREFEFFQGNLLLIFNDKKEELFLFFLKEKREEFNKLTSFIEENYFFSFNDEEMGIQQDDFFSHTKKEMFFENFELISNKKEEKSQLYFCNESRIISRKKAEKFQKDLDSFQKLCFMQLSLDIKQKDLHSILKNIEKTVEEKSLKIFTSSTIMEKTRKFYKDENLTTLSFLGNNKDLFNFFKENKPEYLFPSGRLFASFQKSKGLNKAVEKLLHLKTLAKNNLIHSDKNCLFIDLTNMTSENRFIIIKNILKGIKEYSNEKHHTPESHKNKEDDLTGYSTYYTDNGFTEEKDKKKCFRGSNSDKKSPDQCSKALFTSDNEETKTQMKGKFFFCRI